MRLFSILAAVVAALLIYAFVFERDRLTASLGMVDTAETQADTTDTSGAPEADGTEGTDGADETSAAIGVVAVHSRAEMIDNAVIVRGQTEAQRQVDARAETSGRVISEPLRKGAFVEAGQIMCELDPGTRKAALAEAEARRAEAEARIPEAEARLAEAQARLAEAEINDTAASRLSESGFASDTRVAGTRAALSAGKAAVEAAKSGLDAARTGIQSAAAGVAAAREELERLKIAAPFAGLLESDTAELGSLLQPGALCATVIQLDPIKLVGFVPETAVDRIETGSMARAQLVSGREVTGQVSFLSRSADPETRTFRVEVTVPNPDLALRDGQTAEIAIASEGTSAHLLPQSALTLNDNGVLGVRIVSETDEGARAEFVAVTLLRDTPNGIWVAGLPEAADVIVIGQEYVIDGVPVAATFREDKAGGALTEAPRTEAIQ
ncbi:membrane fusion protein, multidrug efflux system [Roseovarius nanhaiticus]|uniref:Membrane fusion protein, multidrug efflux system n=1 Tax=Roseovarius nanhaiticus TaxID=573024 RepID=A0A1N7GW63_9RHOB|nr:efflux RND transporter periplasmic adaptor subunit [Roseovarius nanhaiticus]SEL32025.1 membrane fusion protein, multidrug efflux system [Roseovarius nanhaiticus]SIS16678.1 membrane fusion protein, multidrug efflux system [Roseovarius nanhaiticus]